MGVEVRILKMEEEAENPVMEEEVKYLKMEVVAEKMEVEEVMMSLEVVEEEAMNWIDLSEVVELEMLLSELEL